MRIQHLESRIQKGTKAINSKVAPIAQAVSFRTGTTEKRVDVGKGGCEIGKWCSFSHLETALTRLFPQLSTQVVDFPHLAMVSQAELGTNIGKLKKNHSDTEVQSQRKLGTKMGRLN